MNSLQLGRHVRGARHGQAGGGGAGRYGEEALQERLHHGARDVQRLRDAAEGAEQGQDEPQLRAQRIVKEKTDFFVLANDCVLVFDKVNVGLGYYYHYLDGK